MLAKFLIRSSIALRSSIGFGIAIVASLFIQPSWGQVQPQFNRYVNYPLGSHIPPNGVGWIYFGPETGTEACLYADWQNSRIVRIIDYAPNFYPCALRNSYDIEPYRLPSYIGGRKTPFGGRFGGVGLASVAVLKRVGYVWEYYPRNATCHKVRYAEYKYPEPETVPMYVRTVMEGQAGVSYGSCGDSNYPKVTYSSVDITDSMWKWGYNVNTKTWTWHYGVNVVTAPSPW